MTKEKFFKLLSQEVSTYKSLIEAENSEWIVKGFIDIKRNIYTITNDTKVVSKIIEILLIPQLSRFAEANELVLELPSKQNFYPDLTFRDKEGNLFAVDIKTSYYKDGHVNGLTLGSYWGYFRERDKVKSMDYTYNSYASHIVLGILYKQAEDQACDKKIFDIDELTSIRSVIKDFIFFVQPKWRIANDIPGSGNTRNIGGVTKIEDLINGNGVFANLGEDIFNDYWVNYYNKQDAQKAGLGEPHYNNLASYKEYLKKQNQLLEKFK